MERDGKEESQRERGAEKLQSDSLGGGQRGIQESGSIYGNVSLAISRFNWATESESVLVCLLGGILQQLLTTEKQRLSEVKECVEWYEREEKVVKARIEEIEQLLRLANQLPTEAKKSENLETNE